MTFNFFLYLYSKLTTSIKQNLSKTKIKLHTVGPQYEIAKKNLEFLFENLWVLAKILGHLVLQTEFKNSIYNKSYASWREAIRRIFA